MEKEHSAAESRWPASAILMYGTFEIGTPAARRYHIRSGLALASVVLWVLVARRAHAADAAGFALALVPGLAFTFIAWEFRRYLLSLDELARRIHLESIAWTYLTGFAIAMLLGPLAMAAHWNINPMWFMVLEPVRGLWLYAQSRRY